MITREKLKTEIHAYYILLLITAGLFSLISHGLAMVYADLTLLTVDIVSLALYVMRVRKSGSWTDWRYFRTGLPSFLKRFFSYGFTAYLFIGLFYSAISVVPTLMISDIVWFFFGHHVVRAHMLLIFAGSFVGTFALFCINHAYNLGRDTANGEPTDGNATMGAL